MKLALLGESENDRDYRALLAESSRHEVTTVADVSDRTADLFRNARRCETGENLLEQGDFDAVLVAGSRERTLQTTKQLAGQGIPLILIPSAGQGSAILYELSLIRDDNLVPLFVLFPSRRHPLVTRVREILDNNELGELIQFEWNRTENELNSQSRIELAVCDRRLLDDVDLLRQLGGHYNQVTALRTGAEGSSIAAQSVTLSGNGLPEALWMLRTGNDRSWTLSIRGSAGTLELKSDRSGEIATLQRGDRNETATPAEVIEAELQDFDDIEAALESPRIPPDWQEFVHEMEIVETTYQSVRRRRTIDLYFELTSERNQFKTQMTALGCGILMLTLFLVVLVLILGQMFDLPPGTMQIARIFAFAPLFLFLISQVLILIARPSADQK